MYSTTDIYNRSSEHNRLFAVGILNCYTSEVLYGNYLFESFFTYDILINSRSLGALHRKKLIKNCFTRPKKIYYTSETKPQATEETSTGIRSDMILYGLMVIGWLVQLLKQKMTIACTTVAYLLWDPRNPLNQHDQSWVFSSVIHIYMIKVWLAQICIQYL